MKIQLLLISFFWIAITASAQAQKAALKGSVIDGRTQKAFELATVNLRQVTDSVVVASAASKADGSYQFTDIKPGKYVLGIYFIGYQSYKKTITLLANQTLTAEKVALQEEANLLKTVVVEAKVPDVVVKTDTLEFSAQNIPVRENAVAEDVIKKIPGIEVDKSGAITAQGEKVTKVRVDGKEFFTNDPTMATRNIPADIIDKIQVIDNLSDQSQFSGVDDGNREKIINITTKPGKNQGTFGQVNASVGSNGRYSENGNINKFSKTNRLSLVADFNNINKQNFTGDNSTSSSTTGRGGFNNMGGLTQSGVQTVSSAGINYDADMDEMTRLNASYSFDKTNLNLIQNSVVQNLLANNNSVNNINQTNLSNTLRHRFSGMVDHKLDTLTSLRLQTNISVLDNSANNAQNYINIFNNNNSKTIGNQAFTTKNLAPTFNNDILLRHRFKTKGRSVSLSMSTAITDGALNTNNQTQTDAFDAAQNETLSTVNQYTDQVNSSFSNTLRLVYTEPLVKNLFLELNAQNRYNYSDVKRQVFDFNRNTMQYDLANDSLTNIYQNKYYTNTGGLSVNYSNKIINWNVGLSVQNTDLISNNLSRDLHITQTQWNYLPSAMFQYRLNKTKRLRFNYRGATNQPTIDQIAPITDNTNPLSIRIGNANLKQEFNHSFRLGLNSFNTASQVSFFSFMGFNVTQDAISNKISLDASTGKTVQQAVNVNGVYAGNGFASFGFPIVKKVLSFNVSLSGNYSHGVNYLDNLINNTQSLTLNNNYKIILNKDKFDFTLGAGLIYNRALYSAQPSSNTKFYTATGSLDISYMFPGDIRLAADVNYYKNTGRGEGFDRAFTLLNGYVSKQLLKSKLLTVKFSVNDALKNNLGINRTISTYSISDLRYNVLQRYYLFTLTYKISKFGSKNMEPDPDGPRRNWRDGGGDQGPRPGGGGGMGGGPPRD